MNTTLSGRLFQGLEERVLRVGAELVRLVDDEHLVTELHRAVADGLAHLLDVGDAPVAGGVHLDDVDARPLRDAGARVAFVARLGSRPLVVFAVEGLASRRATVVLAVPRVPVNR
jgi:hypothetical protein